MNYYYTTLLLTLYSFVGLAQYNDTLIFDNNQKIICDIKQMTKGVCEVETSYSDSDFKIEWNKIKKINSDKIFAIFTKANGIYSGRIKTINVSDSIIGFEIIEENRDWLTVSLLDIVIIKSYEQKIINRIRANIDVAWNWTKANNLHQVNFNSGIRYFTDHSSVMASASSVRSFQDSVPDIKRTDGNIGYSYFLPRYLFFFGRIDFLENTEQRLDLRTSTTIGAGYSVIYDYRKRIGFSLGLSWNNEKYSDQEDRINTAEAYIELDCQLYNYSIIDLNVNYRFFPSISEFGRVRNDLDFSLKLDLPLDFYIGFNYKLNYDNRPQDGASKIDFVLQTTFGWEWDP